MFSHLLAASRHCILVGGICVRKERDSLGERVGEVLRQQSSEIYNKPTQSILSVI